MAKRKTTTRAKPTPQPKESVKSSDVMKMPSKATVIALAKDIRAANKQKGTISEEIAEIIAERKKSQGIHPGALKRVEALVEKAKKTDRGLAAVATELAHFDYYRDVLGLDQLLEQQGQMIARSEIEEGEDGDEDEAEAPKTGLPFGDHVRKLAETSGARPSDE